MELERKNLEINYNQGFTQFTLSGKAYFIGNELIVGKGTRTEKYKESEKEMGIVGFKGEKKIKLLGAMNAAGPRTDPIYWEFFNSRGEFKGPFRFFLNCLNDETELYTTISNYFNQLEKGTLQQNDLINNWANSIKKIPRIIKGEKGQRKKYTLFRPEHGHGDLSFN
jgi:hypothetical protein